MLELVIQLLYRKSPAIYLSKQCLQGSVEVSFSQQLPDRFSLQVLTLLIHQHQREFQGPNYPLSVFELLQYQDYIVKLYSGAGFKPKTVKTNQLTSQREISFHTQEGAILKTPLFTTTISWKWHPWP